MQNVIDMHLHDETITRFSKHTECFFMAVSLYGHRTGEIGFPQKIPVLEEIDFFKKKTYQIGKIISLCVRPELCCVGTVIFP